MSVLIDDIQLAENFMSEILLTGAAKIFVMASATASLPEAGGLIVATGVRSPIAIASPFLE